MDVPAEGFGLEQLSEQYFRAAASYQSPEIKLVEPLVRFAHGHVPVKHAE
jgi:hypothetical protein